MKKLCSVDGCESDHDARGLCNKHYLRLKLTGSLVARQAWRDQTVEQRFWSKIVKGETDDCWPWTDEVNSKGYGRFSTYQGKRKRYLAHRYAYELTNGSIPDGVKVLHSCDNPPCCNPSHLWLGTQVDNMRDALIKGRMNMAGLALGQQKGKRLSAGDN